MNTFSFRATCVATEHPDGICHLVGFADKKHETEIYLLLQRLIDDDEQEVKLGMNTYHVEWCGQQSAGYGGIARFVLKPSVAEITFKGEMVEVMAGMEHLSISFDISACDRSALEASLSKVFSEDSCFEVADV